MLQKINSHVAHNLPCCSWQFLLLLFSASSTGTKSTRNDFLLLPYQVRRFSSDKGQGFCSSQMEGHGLSPCIPGAVDKRKRSYVRKYALQMIYAFSLQNKKAFSTIRHTNAKNKTIYKGLIYNENFNVQIQ